MIFTDDQFTCDSLTTFALSFPASYFNSLSSGGYGCLLYSYILVSALNERHKGLLAKLAPKFR
jgi:hypothetical protein